MFRSEKQTNLYKALQAAQDEIKSVAFNARNPFYQSDYADLGAYIKALRPILSKHGLVVLQTATSAPPDLVGVDTILAHAESGEFIQDVIMVPIRSEDEGGDENKKKSKRSMAQMAGSHITYLRRYGLATVVGAYAGDDDDGNLQTNGHTAPRQAKASGGDQQPTQQGKGKAWTNKQMTAVSEVIGAPFDDKRMIAFLDATGMTKSASIIAIRTFAEVYKERTDEHHEDEQTAFAHARAHWTERLNKPARS